MAHVYCICCDWEFASLLYHFRREHERKMNVTCLFRRTPDEASAMERRLLFFFLYASEILSLIIALVLAYSQEYESRATGYPWHLVQQIANH
jgi:hypothetical protein